MVVIDRQAPSRAAWPLTDFANGVLLLHHLLEFLPCAVDATISPVGFGTTTEVLLRTYLRASVVTRLAQVHRITAAVGVVVLQGLDFTTGTTCLCIHPGILSQTEGPPPVAPVALSGGPAAYCGYTPSVSQNRNTPPQGGVFSVVMSDPAIDRRRTDASSPKIRGGCPRSVSHVGTGLPAVYAPVRAGVLGGRCPPMPLLGTETAELAAGLTHRGSRQASPSSVPWLRQDPWERRTRCPRRCLRW